MFHLENMVLKIENFICHLIFNKKHFQQKTTNKMKFSIKDFFRKCD